MKSITERFENYNFRNMSPKITWDDFIKACWSYFDSKKDHINMYVVFDLPPVVEQDCQKFYLLL